MLDFIELFNEYIFLKGLEKYLAHSAMLYNPKELVLDHKMIMFSEMSKTVVV